MAAAGGAPLSVLDDRSRYVLVLAANGSTQAPPVREQLENAFHRCGVPEAMLMDHGTPWWSAKSPSGRTSLSRWLMHQGIRLCWSRIRHPQTQGKVERFHGSLQRAWRRRGVPRHALQAWLDDYRWEHNHVRPHEALQMKTPASVWQPSARKYDPQPPRWEYPAGAWVLKVDPQGKIEVRGWKWKISSRTVAKDAERSRRRELEESYNQIKRRTLPPKLDRAGSEWLVAERPHLAQRTYEIYEVAFRCHLKPKMGSALLCDLDASEISSYQAKRKAEGASARTLNKELQVLRQILKRHKMWANLQGDVKFEREHNDIGKALTATEESTLLLACGNNALLKAVVTLALNTALRKSEIRTLRWNQVDFEKRTLTVGRSKTHAGSGRLIPLNQPASDALAKWAGRLVEARPDHFVFPACEAAGIEREHPDKERIDPSKPIGSWRSALKRAELQIRFHDLRHACITKLAESQASEHTLMSIAGHVSRKMIEHYSHIRIEAKRAALDAIARPAIHARVAQNWAHTPVEPKPPVRN